MKTWDDIKRTPAADAVFASLRDAYEGHIEQAASCRLSGDDQDANIEAKAADAHRCAFEALFPGWNIVTGRRK